MPGSQAAERRLQREEAAEAPTRLQCRVGAGVRGCAGCPVGCQHPATRGDCGHGEFRAEIGVSRAPRLGLCSPARGSSPPSPHHPDPPALHVPGRRPNPGRLRGPELGAVGRGHCGNSHFLGPCHPPVFLHSDLALSMSVAGGVTCHSRQGFQERTPMD